MTLKQIEDRIRALATRHKQIKAVSFGEPSDYLNKSDAVYPVCFFQDSTGTIDTASRIRTVNYKVFLLDLVNVSFETETNEREVMSDMLEVATDLTTLLDDPEYPTWKISATPFSFIKDQYADVVAGVAADVAISVLTVKDKCAIPKDGPFYFENEFGKEFQ